MSGSSEQKVVLVVDDAPMNISMLAGILKGTYKVKVAKDGERALRAARTVPLPDVVLLDVVMPGMDGYEVCERLKADPATRDIPVVFVTGLTEGVDKEKGLKLGALAYLKKPVDAVEVMDKLREILVPGQI